MRTLFVERSLHVRQTPELPAEADEETGNDTTTQGIFIPLIDLERPQRGECAAVGMLRVKETCIDCYAVLITYPEARRVDVKEVEVNPCVLGRCLLWVKER